MHINSDRLTDSLTQVELLHIESCTQCKIEREKLMALKLSANQIDAVAPPNSIWRQLEAQLPGKTPKKLNKKTGLVAVAATVFMMALSWLFWSNYQLHQQFEEVLVTNKLLEEQLIIESIPTIAQVGIISELEKLTTQLYFAKDKKEKLYLLQKRREVFQRYFEKASQKESENEFSI